MSGFFGRRPAALFAAVTAAIWLLVLILRLTSGHGEIVPALGAFVACVLWLITEVQVDLQWRIAESYRDLARLGGLR